MNFYPCPSVSICGSLLGSALLLLVGAARYVNLAPLRLGWIYYLANVAWEIFPKKVGIPRGWMEAAASLAGLALLKWGGASWLVLGGAVGVLGVMQLDAWLSSKLHQTIAAGLCFTLEGPFIERRPRFELGVLWKGVAFDLEIIVLNPSHRTHPHPLTLRLEAPADWLGTAAQTQTLAPLPSGGVGRIRWNLRPQEICGCGKIVVRIENGAEQHNFEIAFDSCREAACTSIAKAEITRYPGGRRSAFVWRGDMDLYDTQTFQSIAGLETTLGLSARYAFPQTMCLSTRLSLDAAAAHEWAKHTGVETGASEIPRFIQWMNEKVELRHSSAFPAKASGKPFLIELGNHGHLHYDTAAAAAPENGWKSHAKMGAGRYPWMGTDASSFGEQRDNILEAARWFSRAWNFTPRSWAKPGRGNDANTARAAAAAGCEVLSGSDIRARDNVLFQPPPHHPRETDAVELTSRYPPDPQNGFHFSMLIFWLNRAIRKGIPMVYMCHQHMRLWEGDTCATLTEALLRTVVADFNGELYINTLFGVGKYWREVISPKTRRVIVTLLDGSRLRLENRSDEDFENIPVDLTLADGSRSTRLVSVPRASTVEVTLSGDPT